jgi:uncharacterized protein (TIGR02145 family)
MKKLFLLLAVLTINTYLFSQSMVVHNYGGLNDTYDVATVDSITFLPFQCGVNKVSYAGKIYNTVQIGTQCWLKENLDVGTQVNVSVDQTNNDTIEKYCYNDDPANCTTYGGLYQWDEAMQYVTTPGTKGICPEGWHIPTNAEFQTLATTVSNNSNALKAVGQGTGGGAGTNTSGFSALLAGNRHTFGYFLNLGNFTAFWSSTENGATGASNMSLYYDDSSIYFGLPSRVDGYSVRCAKD